MVFLLLLSNLFAFDILCSVNRINPVGSVLAGINDLSMYMSEMEEHPFPAACSDYKKVESPNQNIYSFSLAPQDEDGNKTQKFFHLLRNRIKETIEYQKNRAQVEKKCIESPGGTVDACIEVSPVIKRMLTGQSEEETKGKFTFGRLVQEARFNLALSQSPSSFANFFSAGAKTRVNTDLESYGTHKAEEWLPLVRNSKEDVKARAWLDSYKAQGDELTAAMPRRTGAELKDIADVKKQALAAHRLEHLATYQTIMSVHPVLQYIKSSEPDTREVSGAIDSVLASIEKEEDWFKDKTEGLDQAELSTSLLSLLNYSGEVVGVLKEYPEFCSLVKKWITLRDAKEMGFDMSAGLLVMGGSFLFPPAFAVTGPLLLGVGAGASYVAYDTVRKKSTVFQVEGRMDGRADPRILRQLSEEEVQRLNGFLLSLGGANFKQLPFVKRLLPTSK